MKNFIASKECPNSTPDGQRSIVANVNECMHFLRIGRAKLYQLLNSNELESYLEGRSRKILWRSIETYIERRLHDEACRRNRGD